MPMAPSREQPPWHRPQVRDSAGDILPFTQIGGIALGMRVLVLGGVAPARAVAADIVDVTAELMAQSPFILLGIAVAAPAIRTDPQLGPYLGWLVAGALLFAGGILVFAFLQLAGSRFAEMVLGRVSIGADAASFRGAIHALYRQRSRVALSVGLHLVGWCASGLWLWVVLGAWQAGRAHIGHCHSEPPGGAAQRHGLCAGCHRHSGGRLCCHGTAVRAFPG